MDLANMRQNGVTRLALYCHGPVLASGRALTVDVRPDLRQCAEHERSMRL